MSFRIEPTETVQESLRRVTHEQIDKALAEIADPDLEDHDTVHQVRKRCKKVRALARLVRKAFGEYSSANEALRDTARRVSDLRDARVRVDTFDQLVEIYQGALDRSAVAPIRAALVEQRDTLLHRQVEEEGRMEALRSALEGIRDTAAGWELDKDGFDAVAGGFAKTYRRARKRLKAASEERSAEVFHEWRKRVKYHRYQVRLLGRLWPAPLRAWRESLHTLTDLLGEGNDLTELTRAEAVDAAAEAPARDVLVALARHRRAALWDDARSLGETLFADPADPMVDRLQALWAAH